MDDKTLIDWYNQGWHDELKGTTSTVPEGICLKAYQLGASHAICGDEGGNVGISFDLLTEEEILLMIKN